MSSSRKRRRTTLLRRETITGLQPAIGGTLLHVQALRAIAALFVVILHTLSIGEGPAKGTSLSAVFDLANFGAVGVDIFFVISGFIMVYVAQTKFQKPGVTRAFLVKRLFRVAPIYWFFTVVYVLLLLTVPAVFGSDEFSLSHTVRSYLFIPSQNPKTGSPYPVLTPGWTLTFEMYFYAIFACFLMAPRRVLLPGLTLLLGASSLLSLVGFEQASVLGTLTEPLLLEFLLGCYIGVAFASGYRMSKATCSLLFAAGMGLLAVSIVYGAPDVTNSRGGFPRFFAWGIPSALVVCGAIFRERVSPLRVPRPLVALGDSSYALYLTHIFTLPVLTKLWLLAGLEAHVAGDIFLVVAVALSAAVGHVVYLALERPLNEVLRPVVSRLASG